MMNKKALLIISILVVVVGGGIAAYLLLTGGSKEEQSIVPPPSRQAPIASNPIDAARPGSPIHTAPNDAKPGKPTVNQKPQQKQDADPFKPQPEKENKPLTPEEKAKQEKEQEKMKQMAEAKKRKPRTDPFALLPAESQRKESDIRDLIGLPKPISVIRLQPTEDMPPKMPPLDRLPYMRLAGVISGDVMAAILEVHTNPVQTFIIHPGDIIDDWRVAVLTQDFAILKREGDRRPKEVTIRRETPPDASIRGAGTQGY